MEHNALAASKYDAKYDLVKLILSLLVLAIHAQLYPMVLYPWLRIAVPLFFMISSYFLFSKLHSAPAERQRSILKNFALRNLQLYACWLVILLPITLYVRKDRYFAYGFVKNIFVFIRSALFGSTFVASWFITAMVIGAVIVYYLSKWLRRDFAVFCISLFTFCVVSLASSYMSVLGGTFAAAAIEGYIDIFGGLVCSFPASVFWIFVGKMAAEKKLQIRSLRLLIFLTVICCIGLFAEWKFVLSLDGSYNNDSYFMLAPVCVLLFLGIQKIPPVRWEKSVYLKRASTVIYVVHGSAVMVISKLVSVIFGGEVRLLAFVLTFGCCIAIYAAIETAIRKCPGQRVKNVLKMLY